MKLFLRILLLSLLSCSSYSQTFILSGRITNKKEALPFATVILAGSTNAVNSNIDGYYTLKLAPGSHTIIYQYIGFTKHTETVLIKENKTLDVDLKPEGISLKEIEVTAGEDPAIVIVRNAVNKRKFYLGQIPQYSCDA